MEEDLLKKAKNLKGDLDKGFQSFSERNDKNDFSQFAGTDIGFSRDPSQTGVPAIPTPLISNTQVEAPELEIPTRAVVAPAPQIQADPAQAIVSGAQKIATRPIAKTPEQLRAEGAPTDRTTRTATGEEQVLQGRIEKAMGLSEGTLGREQAQLEEERLRGVEEQNQRVAQKQGEIQTLAAEFDSAIVGLEGQGRGIPLSLITGQQGLLRRQKAAEIGIKQAELLAITGQRDAAQKAADRAVDLEFDARDQELQNALLEIELVKPLADAAERKRLEAREDEINGQSSVAKDLKDNKKFFIEQAIDNQQFDVVSALMTAGSVEELAQAASGIQFGNSIDDIYKRLQISKLQSSVSGGGGVSAETDEFGRVLVNSKDASKLNKEIRTSDAFQAIQKGTTSLAGLNRFEELFNKVGTTSGVTSPFDESRLAPLYNAAVLDLKEFFNLGVLNGPDLEVIQSVLPKPTGQGFVTNIAAKGSTKAGLANIKSMINDTLDDRYRSIVLQFEQSPESVGALRDLQITYIDNKSKLDSNIKTAVDSARKEFPGISDDEIIQIISN